MRNPLAPTKNRCRGISLFEGKILGRWLSTYEDARSLIGDTERNSTITDESVGLVPPTEQEPYSDLAGEVSGYSVTEGQITERLLRELRPFHLSWKYGYESTCETDCGKVPMMDLSDAVARLVNGPRPK